MLTDDFGLRPALDALRAGVPGHHVTAGVKHEDRVVDDARHQKPEALLAAAKLFLDRTSRADVLDFEEEIERCPGCVAHRREG